MKKVELIFEGKDSYFFQEAFKTLRTNIQFCGQDIQVISFTSSAPGEGKSVVCLNLASSFADLGKKVLMIDADMRKSAMMSKVSAVRENITGLSEYLSGMSPLEDCIFETQYPELHVMFAGKYPPNPSELLSSGYFKEMMNILRGQYDYILIDTPPLGVVIDAAIISACCDGTALVIGNSRISRRIIQGVIGQLRKSDVKILGVIRNQSGKKKKSFFRKDYYGKSYSRYQHTYYRDVESRQYGYYDAGTADFSEHQGAR